MAAITPEEIGETPLLPRDDGPVFREPWQARAFAMTLKLAEQKVFTWGEWCKALSDEIKHAQAAGDPDLGDTYYDHWLGALEKLIVANHVSSAQALKMALDDWRAADHARAFGEAPVYQKGFSAQHGTLRRGGDTRKA